jgi:hypothetical protein
VPVPVKLTGPLCARRGCRRPLWKDELCSRCWRFGNLFQKPPDLLAYQPLDGYADDRDAVELRPGDLEQLLGGPPHR